VLVVWRLDRLGRTLKHLIGLMAELEGQGIGFQSTTEAIDTTTPGGKVYPLAELPAAMDAAASANSLECVVMKP
jgi:DNA invertase Pin-like site-specific DNA recombinase